jgi:FkbM family methyltransferase
MSTPMSKPQKSRNRSGHQYTLNCLGLLSALILALVLVSGCAPRVSCRLEKFSFKKADARYHNQTLRVMKRVLKSGSTAVDVGSFKGNVMAQMVEAAPQGTHYAFEPIPKMAAVVRKRFPSPRVKVHEMALGDHAGFATFQHVTTNPAYSGLKRRGLPRKNEVVVPIKVRVDTLDNVLPPTAKVAFLKIDVEGGEYGVLKGAVKTVRRCRPVIVVEFGASALKYGVSAEKMYRMLTQTLGLKVNLMSCWLRGEPAFTQAQFLDQYKAGRNWYYIAYP